MTLRSHMAAEGIEADVPAGYAALRCVDGAIAVSFVAAMGEVVLRYVGANR